MAKEYAESATDNRHCYRAILSWFRDNGWKELPVKSHNRHDADFFKNFPNAPKCRTNEPEPLQLRAKIWNHRKYDAAAPIGIEIELCAEPVKDDGWIVIKAYAFNSVEDVPHQCERLIKAWAAICPFS